MNKKSQISVLIIFALILMISIIFLINTQYEFKKANLNEHSEFIREDSVKVKEFVDFCLERQSEHAFEWVMIQGGYYEQGKYSEDPIIKFLVKDNVQIDMEEEEILNGIKMYLEDTLPFCINNFVHFENLEINSGELNIFVEYTANRINVNLEYPLDVQIINDDYNFNLDKFEYKLNNVDLDTILNDVEEYTNEFTKEFDGEKMAEFVLDFEETRENLDLEIVEVEREETQATFTNFFLYNFSNRKVPVAFSIKIKE